MTLYQETVKVLEAFGHNVSQVRWVGLVKAEWNEVAETGASGPAGWFTWDEFVASAQCNYFRGYGPVYVRPNLVVVGDDWWLEREEYDGHENWAYKRMPVQGERRTPPENLCDGKGEWEE